MHQVLKSDTKFVGRVFTTKIEEVILPNGSHATREIAEHIGGASVVAVEGDEVILVRQYRHAVKDYVLEIPAGVLEAGEDPAHTAKRELQEETGAIAGEIIPLTKIYKSVGHSTEINHIYLGRNLTFGPQNLDEGEDVEVVRMKIEEVVDRCLSGEIVDSKTLAGIFAYREYIRRN